jgi:predicted DNA-binding transcriptional regulator AlpA
VDQLLTPPEVARLLNVTTRTLHNWRNSGDGPPWVKLGEGDNAPVRYDRESLESWIKERER